ncbi:SdpI family protein [Paenibacillus sp. N3.4]|uniref:SdpI family protein n=1 Tax=Paenibacillus sp. N3.4 TaxID=2603222 RepID=UPI0011CA1AA1|nr:SdpI family protein [Paenibacillus sp. N3.4]TXK76895.1 SdpI family protein [Paenibacillus sp. N3.4]
MSNKAKLKWGWRDIVLLVIVLIPVVIGLAMYKELPDQLASHFDMQGNANRFMSKPLFFTFMIVLNLVIAISLKVVPKLDPKRANYEKFTDVYELLRVVIVLFLSGIFVMVLLHNRGYAVPMSLVMYVSLGGLWIIFGNYMGRIRHNYTLGIRTPWTLANEEVWRKTHRLTGPLWVLCGLVMLVCGFIGNVTVPYVLFVCIGISIAIPVLYSYVIYRRILHDGKKQ